MKLKLILSGRPRFHPRLRESTPTITAILSFYTPLLFAASILSISATAQTTIIATGAQLINSRDPIINNRGTIVLHAFGPGNIPTIFKSLGGGLSPFASAGSAFQDIRAVALDDEDKIIFGGETTDDREGIFFGPELPDEDDEWATKGFPNVLAIGGGFFVTDRFEAGTLFRIEPSAGLYWYMRLLDDPDTQELIIDPPPQMNNDGVVVFVRRQKQTQLYTLVRAQLVPDTEPGREEYFVPEMQDLAALPSKPNRLSFGDTGLVVMTFGDDTLRTISINNGTLTEINIPNIRFDPSSLSINDEGVIAVSSEFFDPLAGPTYTIMGIEGGAATKIVAIGDLVGNDYILSGIQFGPQGFNNAGRLVFRGSLQSRTNGPSIDAIMLTSGGNEPPVEPPVDGYHWINESGGSFNNAANWDADEVPASSHAAFFDLPGSYTVNGGNTIGWMFVGNEPSVNVTLENADIQVLSTDPTSPGVFINEGNFTLASGSLRSVLGLVGASAITRATISGGLWDNQALLTIGQGGETTMVVEEDGHLRSPLLRIGNAHNGAFGTLTLDGGKLDAADLDIGRAGAGTFIIENGGLATVDYNLFALPGPGQGGFFPEVIIGSGPPGSTGRTIVRGAGADTNQVSRIIVAGAHGVVSSSGATGELLIEDRGVAEFWQGLTVGDLRSDAKVTVRSLGQLIVTNSGGVAEGSLSIAGIGGRAELLVDGGAVHSTHAEIGNSLGVSGLGTTTLTNAGFWEIEKTLNVGGSTPETSLTIAGGQLLIGDSLGAPGEEVNILETTLRVGTGDELAGTLTITGASILAMGRNRVEIGRDGFGAFVISAGGQFIGASQLILGESYLDEGARDVLDDATVVVTGFSPDAASGDPNARSSLVMSEGPNDIYEISIADRGEMFVEAGALVEVPFLTISGEAQSQGRLVVNGTGNQLASTLIARQISLGDYSATGYGHLVVSSNAIISVQTLRVFANAEVNFDTGAILVGPGNSAPAGSLIINTGGRLEGDGRLVHEALGANSARLTAAAATTRGVFNLGGVVAPGGPSGGALTIQGNYTQGTNGTLEIKLAGPSQHGQIVVTGSATFEPGTKIRLLLADPNPDDQNNGVFVPREGDNFNFLDAQNIVMPASSNIGDFIEFANAPPGLEVEFDLALVEGKTRVTARTTRSPSGAPRLAARRATTPGNFIISWPTNLTGFLLESSPAIGAAPWTPLTNAPLLNSGHFEITFPTSGEKQFYRLKAEPLQAGSLSP